MRGLIKSTKIHLKKVIRAQTYTVEELTTLVVRIEGVLNSQPLQLLSSDPNDLEALTPGHFLIGQPLLAIPEENVIATNRLRRWELVRRSNHFAGVVAMSIYKLCKDEKSGSNKRRTWL